MDCGGEGKETRSRGSVQRTNSNWDNRRLYLDGPGRMIRLPFMDESVSGAGRERGLHDSPTTQRHPRPPDGSSQGILRSLCVLGYQMLTEFFAYAGIVANHQGARSMPPTRPLTHNSLCRPAISFSMLCAFRRQNASSRTPPQASPLHHTTTTSGTLM